MSIVKKVLITGGDGFIGRALVERLLRGESLPGWALAKLILIDQRFEVSPTAAALDPRVRHHTGDIADPTLLRRALADGIDVVFHLASVPGGLAEREPALGQRVNLGATLELFNQLRELATPPVVVFASSIAVYGAPLPAAMDEATPANPQLSYGAHKLIGEVLLRDFSRRGWIDGRALRLPGVVARPRPPAGQGSGLMSAYMSDILHALAAGEEFICPVSADAVSWWMSAACCVDNLLHAASLRIDLPQAERCWVLPVLRATMTEIVEGLSHRFGDDRRALVRYAPNAALEAAFGRYPPLRTPHAEAAGFRHDGSIDGLLQRCALRQPASRHG